MLTQNLVHLLWYNNWTILSLCTPQEVVFLTCPPGSPSRGGDIAVYVWHKPSELAHSFLFLSCVFFCLCGPFNCISFHKFSCQLSAFSLCSSSLISALLVLLTIYFFMKIVSLSPDIILCGWLGLKHQWINLLTLPFHKWQASGRGNCSYLFPFVLCRLLRLIWNFFHGNLISVPPEQG